MKIYIDNREFILNNDEISLSDAIMNRTTRNDGIAAFVNQRVVERSKWELTRIQDGDRITVIFAIP